MASISIGRAWDEAWAFLRAESALLLPVAAATFGAAMMLLILVMPQPVEGKLPVGPWMIWLAPFYALALFGVLAINTLALRPGASVRESLGQALRKLPAAAMVAVLMLGISTVLSLPAGAIGAIELARGGKGGAATAIADAAMAALFAWLYIRLLPIWATVADLALSPLDALRRSFALTRGHAARLFALALLAFAAAAVCGAALLFGAGAVLMAVGRALGGEPLASLLLALLLAGIFATGTTIWSVFVAFLYRQLSAASA